MIAELSHEEAHAMLRRGKIARLGCVADGYPYVVPVNYFFDGADAYSHSLSGRKITALRADPRACLQLDEVEDEYRWRCVLATGDFEEIKSRDERAHVLNELLTRFPTLTPVEAALAEDAQPQGIIVFRLRIKQITGVREG